MCLQGGWAPKSLASDSHLLEAKLFWRDGKNAKARKWPGISVFVVQSTGKRDAVDGSNLAAPDIEKNPENNGIKCLSTGVGVLASTVLCCQ